MLFSSITMDHQNNSNNQTVANIRKQQPINPVESINQKSTLDQRIQTIQSMAAQARVLGQAQKPTQSIFQLARSTFQKSTHQQSTSTQMPRSPISEESTMSQSTTEPHSVTTLPTLQLPKKSTLSFIERFQAHHANHQNPEYRKIASIPCDQDKDKMVPIYLFKDEKRSYKAAGEYGTNHYKFG